MWATHGKDNFKVNNSWTRKEEKRKQGQQAVKGAVAREARLHQPTITIVINLASSWKLMIFPYYHSVGEQREMLVQGTHYRLHHLRWWFYHVHEISFANHSDRYLSLLDIVSIQRGSREVFRNHDLQFLINVLYWRIHYNFINNLMIRNAISTENGGFEPNYYANLILRMHVATIRLALPFDRYMRLRSFGIVVVLI